MPVEAQEPGGVVRGLVLDVAGAAVGAEVVHDGGLDEGAESVHAISPAFGLQVRIK